MMPGGSPMHGQRNVRITAIGPLRDGATLFQRLDGARQQRARADSLARFNRACCIVALGTGVMLAGIAVL